jgi:hypothetical protein
VAILENTDATLNPVLALVSKNNNPCYSAKALPYSGLTFLSCSGISILLAIKTFLTLGNAC